ncbi:hypothetical protein KKG71_02205, partial [Patescibacteria group bacterium]|nr:hypothetical protein [Patescibacteria group bacterium]
KDEAIADKALNPSTVKEFTPNAARAFTKKISLLKLNIEDGTGKLKADGSRKLNTSTVRTTIELAKIKERISNYDQIIKTLSVPILGIPPNEVTLGQILTKNNGKNLNLYNLDMQYYWEGKPDMAGFQKGRGQFGVKGPLSKQYRSLHKKLAAEKRKTVKDTTKIAALEKDIIEVYRGLDALKKAMVLFSQMEVRVTANLGAHSAARKYTEKLQLHDENNNKIVYTPATSKFSLQKYLPAGEKLPELLESGILIYPSKNVLNKLNKYNSKKQKIALSLLLMIYSPEALKPYLTKNDTIYDKNKTSLVLNDIPKEFLKNLPKLLKKYKNGVTLSKQHLGDKDPQAAKEAKIKTMYEMRLLFAPKKLAALYQLNRIFNFHDRGPAAIKYKWNALLRKFLPTFEKSNRPITLEEIRAGRINKPSDTIHVNFINGRTAFLKVRDGLSPNKEGFEKRLLKKINEYIKLGVIYEGTVSGIHPRKNQSKVARLNELTKLYSIDGLRDSLTKEQIDYIRKGFLLEEGEKETELQLLKLGYAPKNPYSRNIAMKVIMALKARNKKLTDQQMRTMLEQIDKKISAGIGMHVGSVNGKGEGGIGAGINIPLGNGLQLQLGFAVSHKGAAPTIGLAKAIKAGAVDFVLSASIGGVGGLISIPLEAAGAPIRINAGVGVSSVGGALTATLGGSYDIQGAYNIEARKRQEQYRQAEKTMKLKTNAEKLALFKKDPKFKKALSEYLRKKKSEMPKTQQETLASKVYELTLMHATQLRGKLEQIDITKNLKIPTLMSIGIAVVGAAPPYIIPYIGIKVADQMIIASAESTNLSAEDKHMLLAEAARQNPGKKIVIYTKNATLDLSNIKFSYDSKGQLKGIVDKGSDTRVQRTLATLNKAQSLSEYNKRLSAANITLSAPKPSNDQFKLNNIFSKNNLYKIDAHAPNARLEFRISPDLQNKVKLVYDYDNVYLAFKPGVHFAVSRIDSYYPRKYKGAVKHTQIYIKPSLDWPESIMDNPSKNKYLAKNPGQTYYVPGNENAKNNIILENNYYDSDLEGPKKIDTKKYSRAHEAIKSALAFGLSSRPGSITKPRQSQLKNFAAEIYKDSNVKKLTTFQYPFAGFKKIGKGTPDLGELIAYIKKAAASAPTNNPLGSKKTLSTQEIHVILTQLIHESFRNLEGKYNSDKKTPEAKKAIHQTIKNTLEKSAFPTLKKMFDAHFSEMFTQAELKKIGKTKEQITKAMLLTLRRQFLNINFDNPGQAIAAVEAFGSMAGTRGKEGFVIGLRMLRGYESKNTNSTQASILNYKDYSLQSRSLGHRALAKFLLVTKSRLKTNTPEHLLRSPLAAKVALYAQFIMGPDDTIKLAAMLEKPKNNLTTNVIYKRFKDIVIKVRTAQLAGHPEMYFRSNFPVPNSVIMLKFDTKAGYGLYKRCGNLSSLFDAKIKAEIIVPKSLKGSAVATSASSYITSKAGRMIQDAYMAVSIRYASRPQENITTGGPSTKQVESTQKGTPTPSRGASKKPYQKPPANIPPLPESIGK